MSDRPSAPSEPTSAQPTDPVEIALARAAERSGQDAAAKKASGARKAKIIGGVSAVVLVAALAGYASLPLWIGSLPAALQPHAAALLPKASLTVQNGSTEEVAALQEALGAMQTKLAALEKRVATLEHGHEQMSSAAVAPAPAPAVGGGAGAIAISPTGPVGAAQPHVPDVKTDAKADTSALEKRLGTLETTLGTTLNEQLVALGKEIGELKANRAQASSVLALADRVAAVEGAIQQAMARQDQALAFLLAVGQLRAAVDEGRPFADELKTARAVAPSTIDVETLTSGFAAQAASGVATTIQLQQDFAAQAGAIIRAGALPNETADWWSRTVDRMMSLVSIRRTDGDAVGTSPAAVVSRAEALLKQGALSGAIAELAALDGQAATAAQPWLTAAKARLAATSGLSELTGEALAALTATTSAPPAPPTAGKKEG
ncbi:COG4223 family protein [Insolitispirillum peregrinum]|uniref:COG4223 family protein n=1 Tax=Insolitispirillum peregrinum TaxID=80876 RepID=UPI003618F59D